MILVEYVKDYLHVNDQNVTVFDLHAEFSLSKASLLQVSVSDMLPYPSNAFRRIYKPLILAVIRSSELSKSFNRDLILFRCKA
jgi:hypothetical protein